MKKTILALAVAAASIVSTFAQGTVIFNNRSIADGIDARVTFEGTTTGVGSSYLAQLYAGPVGGALQAVGAAIAFRDGAGAGYMNTTGQDLNRSIGTVSPGAQASVQIRVYDSAYASYEAQLAANAGFAGQSSVISVTTGGAGNPPSTPAPLTGLQAFSVVAVPEPSVIALAILGGGLLLFRRKK